MKKKKLVRIGKIVGLHGVRGRLKVYPFVESLDLFERGTSVMLRNSDGENIFYVITEVKPHKNMVLLMLKDVEWNTAERLVSSEILIGKDRLPILDTGIYYWDDIIGLKVYEEKGPFLGTIISIIETGSNDVYVVRHKEREILVPVLDSVIVSIDSERGCITVNLPEGLGFQ
jgi:16S rRNA processing protein RimM